MNTFRFFWNTHKYTGITLALVFVVTASTGFLLLFKKRADWLQPPTQTGPAVPLAEWISVAEAWEVARRQDHPDFQTLADLDRIDVRPDKGVYKLRSAHNNAELQIAAATGEVLRVDTRTSDWLEDLHDGSWFGEPVRDYVMPVVAVGLLFLVFSGLWLWLEPILKRRRRRRRQARQNAP